jgi:hypothetical protein
MAVGLRKPLHWVPRKQKALEYTPIDQDGSLGGNALVVKAVEAVNRHPVPVAQVGVVLQTNELGQQPLPHLPLEGLPLLIVVLAIALEAMAHCLVEQHTRSGRLEDGRAGVGIERRRGADGKQLVHQPVRCVRQLGVARQPGLGGRIEVTRVVEQLTVIGSGHRHEMHTV